MTDVTFPFQIEAAGGAFRFHVYKYSCTRLDWDSLALMTYQIWRKSPFARTKPCFMGSPQPWHLTCKILLVPPCELSKRCRYIMYIITCMDRQPKKYASILIQPSLCYLCLIWPRSWPYLPPHIHTSAVGLVHLHVLIIFPLMSLTYAL